MGEASSFLADAANKQSHYRQHPKRPWTRVVEDLRISYLTILNIPKKLVYMFSYTISEVDELEPHDYAKPVAIS